MPRSPFDVAIDAPFLAVPYPLIQKLGIAKANLLAFLLSKRRMVHERFGLKPGGWFYCKAECIETELGIPARTQSKWTAELVEAGLIDKRRDGIPAKLYFRINRKKIEELYADWDRSRAAPGADQSGTADEARQAPHAEPNKEEREEALEEENDLARKPSKGSTQDVDHSRNGFRVADAGRWKRRKTKHKRIDKQLGESLRRLWREKGPRRCPKTLRLADQIEWLRENRLSAENIQLAIEWAKEHYDDKYCASLGKVEDVPAIILKWHKQRTTRNGNDNIDGAAALMRRRT